MIKDSHPWPWDVKSPAHSYDDLRRTNCKVIIEEASFNQGKSPPMVSDYSSDPRPNSSFFVCEEQRHRDKIQQAKKQNEQTNQPKHHHHAKTTIKKTKETTNTCKKNAHTPPQAINTHSYQQLHDLYVCMIRASRSTYHDKPSQHLPNCTCPFQGHFKKLSRLPGITSCSAGSALKHKCVYICIHVRICEYNTSHS